MIVRSISFIYNNIGLICVFFYFHTEQKCFYPCLRTAPTGGPVCLRAPKLLKAPSQLLVMREDPRERYVGGREVNPIVSLGRTDAISYHLRLFCGVLFTNVIRFPKFQVDWINFAVSSCFK